NDPGHPRGNDHLSAPTSTPKRRPPRRLWPSPRSRDAESLRDGPTPRVAAHQPLRTAPPAGLEETVTILKLRRPFTAGTRLRRIRLEATPAAPAREMEMAWARGIPRRRKSPPVESPHRPPADGSPPRCRRRR